jgi:hypothetical protein
VRASPSAYSLLHLSTFLGSIACVLIFVQAGYLALRLAHKPDDRGPVAETLALSYGLGVGLITTQMLVFSLIGIGFTVSRILVWWLLAWTAHAARSRVAWRRPPLSPPRTPASRSVLRFTSISDPIAAALLIPLILISAIELLHAAVMPVWLWDVWAVWDLKARIFYFDRSVLPFFSDNHYVLTQLDYPLLVPLAGTLLYLVLGGPHDVVQILSVLFYVSALALFFGVLRRLQASARLAAGLTIGLAFLPNVLRWSRYFQSDIALVFYTLAFVCYTYLYDLERRRWYLVVAGLMAGFLTQTRAEGWFLVLPAVLLLAARTLSASDAASRRHAMMAAAGFIGICVCCYAPWLAVKTMPNVSGGVLQVGYANIRTGLALAPDAVVAMLQWMGDPSYLGEYLLLFPLTLIFVLMNWRRYCRVSGDSFLIVAAIFAALPAIVVMITRPYFLSVGNQDRYLLSFTVVVYVVFAVSVVESAKHFETGARTILLSVANAFVLAVLIVSLPALLSKARVERLSWDLRNGAQGWHLTDDAGSLTFGPHGVGPLASQSSLVTPPMRLDADVIRTIRVTARGTPGTAGVLTLSWKRLRGEYIPNQTVTANVTWTGAFQTVVLTPPWRGTVEEFALKIDDARGVFVRTIQSEPLSLSMLGVALRATRWSLWATVALMLGLLAAWGSFSSRERVHHALSTAFMTLVVALWFLPDVSLVTRPPESVDQRPVELTRSVLRDLSRLASLPIAKRIEALEAEAGRSQIAPLMRETSGQCGTSGSVILFTSPENSDAKPGGYVHQRAGYLLLPRKVFPVSEPVALTELLRQKGVSALIVYGTTLPDNIRGGVAYRNGHDFQALCEPQVLAGAARFRRNLLQSPRRRPEPELHQPQRQATPQYSLNEGSPRPSNQAAVFPVVAERAPMEGHQRARRHVLAGSRAFVNRRY